MSHIQGRYPERKFKVGDFVLAQSSHGNMEIPAYSSIEKEHVGQIEAVYHLMNKAPSNTNDAFPYKVSGHIAGWAEDELTLITIDDIKKALGK